MEAFCAASCDTLAQGRGRYTTNENKLIQINELKTINNGIVVCQHALLGFAYRACKQMLTHE